MDFINILSLLRVSNKKLNNVSVFGLVTGYINKPITLNSSVIIDNNCVCVNVDILAVRFNDERTISLLAQNGFKSIDNIYFVNGSMCSFIDKKSVVPDWYTFEGNITIGSKAMSPLVTMFNFKRNQNQWGISATSVSDIKLDSIHRENERFYKFLELSASSGKVIQPQEVATLAKCVSEISNVPLVEKTKSEDLSDRDISNSYSSTQVSNFNHDNKVQIRNSIDKVSPNYNYLNSTLVSSEKVKINYVKSLVSNFSFEQDNIPNEIVYLLMSIKTYFKSKKASESMTGRALVKGYILASNEALATKKYLGTTVCDYVLSIFDEVINYTLSGSEVSADKGALKLIKELFYEPEKVYAGLVSRIININTDDLVEVAGVCKSCNLSFTKIINNNPYLLCLISQKIKFSDIEHIALCFGKAEDSSIKETKNIGLLNDFVSYSNSGSTVYRKNKLHTYRIGVNLSNVKYTLVSKLGTYLNNTTISNICIYLNPSLNKNSFQYNGNFEKHGYSYTSVLSQSELNNAIKDYIKSGLGVEFSIDNISWVTSTSLLNKELFIYNKIYELSNLSLKKYKLSRINELIDEFEVVKNFKLEERQKEGARLLLNNVGCIIGGAGSGKTTTTELIVYICQNYDDSNITIEFAAPTGKAAKKLQEHTGGTVRTLHSRFGINSSVNENDIFDEEEDSSSNNPDIFIFDENSMVTLDLMYKVLKRIENSRLFLLGDIGQLPPLGKGTPFKGFLRFMPVVRLNVSKRSSEKSGINYNSLIINDCSERNNWIDIKNTDDFKLVPCDDDRISSITSLLCKYYLGKITKGEEALLLTYLNISSTSELIKIDNLTADDIQVVSPLSKPTYDWGTCKVNEVLEPIFNNSNKKFAYQTSSNIKPSIFKIGDRVIHTENKYTLQWYKSYKDGIFEKCWGYGAMNGDVGTIVDMLPSISCEFVDCSDVKPLRYMEPRYKIRDDSEFNDNGKYFIVVEYYNYEFDYKYYILYQASINIDFETNNMHVFTGKDLSTIQLFYAGTCHKLQGSQSRLVLVLLGTVRFKGFINRNMLYTMVTRASDGVYLIGNVSNSYNSQLCIARREKAGENTETIGDLI